MAQAKPHCEILPVNENSQVGASTLRRHMLLSVIALADWYLIYRQLSAVSEWLAFFLLGLNKSNHFGSAVQFLMFETFSTATIAQASRC
jgi:uncharacterized protein